MNLAEFAAAQTTKPGAKCWLCHLPQVGEVNDAHRKGVPYSVIQAWLAQECGYREASRARVVNHLKNHLG